MKKDNKNISVGLIGLAIMIIVGIWFFSSMSSTVSTPDTSAADNTPVAPVQAKKTTTKTIVASAPDVDTSSGVLTTTRSLTSASRFSELLSATGVSSLLTGKGPFTIFVPSDASFGLLPPGTINDLTAAQKKRLVEYHVVVDREVDPDAIIAGSVTTLSKDMLNFTVLSSGGVRINSSSIIKTFKATNGIVYLISGVLIPPTQ
jgi:uncharacterized surface protein with fasciclin (FAS1) repeats